MLSNKLTFSLTSLVVMLAFGLLFVATPAEAQRQFFSNTITTTYTTPADGVITDADKSNNKFPERNAFAIYEMPLTAATAGDPATDERLTQNGIVSTDGAAGASSDSVAVGAGALSSNAAPITTAPAVAQFPNLYDIFRFGGTVELAISHPGVKPDTSRPTKFKEFSHRLVMTEVMWGLDEAATGGAKARPQWIEVYNDPTIADSVHLLDDPATTKVEVTAPPSMVFIFTENNRMDRVGTIIKLTVTDATGVVSTDPAVDGTSTATDYYVVDKVSTTDRFGSNWWANMPGSSGALPLTADGTVNASLDFEPRTLVSMYRKHDLVARNRQYHQGGDKGFGDGSSSGSWAASTGRINMSGSFSGSPGSVHRPPVGTEIDYAKAPASLPATSIIINEVRNDTADANLDWIELHNTGDADVEIKKWTIDMVINSNSDAAKNHKRVVEFPDAGYAKITAGGYLVIYNRDPADTILADGINIADPLNERVQKGAQHMYFVDTDLNLNNSGKFLLVLRNGNDKTNHEKVVDIAGNGFFKVEAVDRVDHTDVFPLRGWTVPGDRDDGGDFGGNNTFASANSSFGRDAQKSRANRLHKDDWKSFGHQGGLGYDQRVDLAIAPGTPGYANNAVKGKNADLTDATVTISEIMYDSGDKRWNLIQWIELYNSSATEAVNLEGWHLEIRNKEDVASYVDSIFQFESGAIILPNQTLLLVSGSARNNVARNRVYNLYQRHRTELGLEPAGRRSTLLSRTGFVLKLWDKDADRQRDKPVDEAGNVEVKGAEREVMWDLWEINPAARQSIVRIYDTRAIDGNGPDGAKTGTMRSSWDQSDILGAGISHYGHLDDIGTPGYRLGGPLPVSLSSFRPVRDKATGEVVIRWITQSELNNAGFNILRSETKNGDFKVVNLKGIIPGHGTTSEKHVYEWTDTSAKPNVVYYYQIEDVSLDGKRTPLATTHLRGNVNAAGKVTTTWGDLKTQQ